jgi:hypothetical protein
MLLTVVVFVGLGGLAADAQNIRPSVKPATPPEHLLQSPSTVAYAPLNNQNQLFRDAMATGYFGSNTYGISQAERKLMSEITSSANAVAKAENSRAEENETKKLRESLAKLFDERIKRREHEIEALEKRFQDLKTKNEERKRKKDEIVDLKLKSVINEAKGFGF